MKESRWFSISLVALLIIANVAYLLISSGTNKRWLSIGALIVISVAIAWVIHLYRSFSRSKRKHLSD